MTLSVLGHEIEGGWCRFYEVRVAGIEIGYSDSRLLSEQKSNRYQEETHVTRGH